MSQGTACIVLVLMAMLSFMMGGFIGLMLYSVLMLIILATLLVVAALLRLLRSKRP